MIKYLFAKKVSDINWLIVLWCRWRGHPAGVVWHNIGGLEPNMTCKICGDDLS